MIAVVALPLLLAVSTPPPGLRNASVESRAVSAGSLAAEVRRLVGAPGPRWIGYAQPIVAGKHRMCCFDSISGSGRNSRDRFCCGGCTLERESQSFTMGGDEDRPHELEGSPGLVVLLRADGGRIGKVRTFDDECGIDAGGLPFTWLTDVRPEESVALLGSIVRQRDDDGREDAHGPALAAVALTAHPAADALLEGLLARGQPRELRKQAAFWTGNSRGTRGFEILRRVIPNDPDDDFRRHGTFALSQSSDPAAIDLVISMAKTDPDGEVRGQALFWLAQRAGDRAAQAIDNAIRDDPDEEVKKKAVFALSQLPKGEAVPELIRVARTNRNAEVRKQAIFWLGQTRDPRALAFIEEILDR
jgi:hypothetical protein